MITIGNLATELDVTKDTISTLIGQISDDPDLVVEDKDGAVIGITDRGAELVRLQIASSDDDRLLDDLAHEFRAAAEDIEDGKARRVAAVRGARDKGASWQQIVTAFGLKSREHARRIAAENR